MCLSQLNLVKLGKVQFSFLSSCPTPLHSLQGVNSNLHQGHFSAVQIHDNLDKLGLANLGNNGLILNMSQFWLQPQLSQKMMLASKEIKNE